MPGRRGRSTSTQCLYTCSCVRKVRGQQCESLPRLIFALAKCCVAVELRAKIINRLRLDRAEATTCEPVAFKHLQVVGSQAATCGESTLDVQPFAIANMGTAVEAARLRELNPPLVTIHDPTIFHHTQGDRIDAKECCTAVSVTGEERVVACNANTGNELWRGRCVWGQTLRGREQELSDQSIGGQSQGRQVGGSRGAHRGSWGSTCPASARHHLCHACYRGRAFGQQTPMWHFPQLTARPQSTVSTRVGIRTWSSHTTIARLGL